MIQIVIYLLAQTNGMPAELAYQLDHSRTNSGITFQQVAGQLGSSNVLRAPNFPDLAAIFDWDQTAFLKNHIHLNPEELRKHCTPALTLETTPNNLRLFKLHADSWLSHWTAGPVEWAILKTLCQRDREAAKAFASKLAANPTNKAINQWFEHWQLLSQKRFAEAATFAKANGVTDPPPVERAFKGNCPTITIDRPFVNRVERFTYYPNAHQWVREYRLPQDNREPIVLTSWTSPKTAYQTAYIRGPGQQAIYEFQDGILKRHLIATQEDAFVSGRITSGGFAETLTTAPGQATWTHRANYDEVLFTTK